MANNTVPASGPDGRYGGLVVLVACLAASLAGLFWASFDPGRALFANDGPYGVLMSNLYKLPAGFAGVWNDLYWLGADSGYLYPNPTGLLLFGLGRRLFVNFYAPLTTFLLGLSAWFFFRQLRFKPWVCVLGGLAAALNTNFFSNACWGLGTRNTCLACIFLALAEVESSWRRFAIIKVILAGLAIGMSISEGGDNGAIFAGFVAAYAFFRALTQEGSLPARAAKGAGRVALMAVSAGVIAMPSLLVFSNAAQTNAPKEQMSAQAQWDWATQWSLPKLETLRVIIPGLYGYRLDSPDGGNYWGTVGQQPGWPKHHQGFPRHSGAGEYAGVLVVLIALWGLANSFSRKSSAFTLWERRTIQVWALLALIALLFAWGRYAGCYWLLYQLPHFSSIRNPMKFMHPFHMTLMILFAYGLAGLGRRYCENLSARAELPGRLRQPWWAKLTVFEASWTWGSVAVLGLGVLAWWACSVLQGQLADHLRTVGFDDPNLSRQMAAFSVREVGEFVLFLATGLALLVWLQSGTASSLGGRLSALGICFLPVAGSLAVTTWHWYVHGTFQGGFAYQSGQVFLGFARAVTAATLGTTAHLPLVAMVLCAAGMAGASLLVYRCVVRPAQRSQCVSFLLGLVLLMDLGRADAPWIKYFHIATKYADNPVLQVLHEKPWEHRVTVPNFRVPPEAEAVNETLQQAYHIEWLQHHFQLFNIQAMEVAQMPRVPEDFAAFNKAIGGQFVRLWQLTNTRYIMALAPYTELFNAQFDAQKRRFRNVLLFDIAPVPGTTDAVTALTNTTGPYALIEFAGTLPRAKLYSAWQVSTNDEATLKVLADPAFDPERQVLVAQNLASNAPVALNPIAGSVQITRYSPRQIELRSDSPVPTVLLLNNRYDPNWRVIMDGHPAPLLRCNFVMQGVQVPPGQHTLVFQFAPSVKGSLLMAVCVACALLLCGFLLLAARHPPATAAPVPVPRQGPPSLTARR